MLVVGIDQFGAEVELRGGSQWQTVVLFPTDFRDALGGSFLDWADRKELRLGTTDVIRTGRGPENKVCRFGRPWRGPPPTFRNLRWVPDTKEELNAHRTVRLLEGKRENGKVCLAVKLADELTSFNDFIVQDRAFGGKPLTVDGKTHAHGLAVHAPSKATFFLGGR